MQQLLILIAFLIAILAGETETLEASWLTPLVFFSYLAIAAGLTGFNSSRTLRILSTLDEVANFAIAKRNRLKLFIQMWLLGGLAGVIYFGYGHWAAVDLGLGKIPLAAKAMNLLPFLLAMTLYWLMDWPFQRELRRRIAARQGRSTEMLPTLGEYLGYNLRHQLLFIAVPVGLIVLFQDIISFYVVPLLGENATGTAIAAGAMIISAGLVFLLSPLMIVRIWRTCPLPDGPIRAQLEQICHKMNLRYRDILIWQSGLTVANAGVMGLAGPVRYILLSDLMLDQMNDEQIKAVFAHEAGHIVSYHIFYLALFAITAGTISLVIASLAGHALGLSVWIEEFISLSIMMTAWSAGFGWLSRKLERQSDVIAAWACGAEAYQAGGDISAQGSAVFCSALQKVAELNGMPLAQKNWRHGSILSRVNYILALGASGLGRAPIDRLVTRAKQLLWLILALALAGLTYQIMMLQ